MGLLWKKSSRQHRHKSSAKRTSLHVEALESRVVPYALTGSAWPRPAVVTVGFVPDGTNLGGVSSNLISTLNARFSLQSYWMNQILKAAQVWAQQTSINFAFVTDNGAAIGSGLYQQGDPLMADIRIGGYDFGSSTLARAYLPPQANNFSIAGDIQFNSAQTWVIGTTGGYDLFTVAMHEFGHALGLGHSSSYFSAVYPNYAGSRVGLGADDVSGIRALYSSSATRAADSFDAGGPNDSFASATIIDSLINPVTLLAVAQERDITTLGDADYFRFTAPLGSAGPMSIRVQTSGQSLLAPTLTVYNSLKQPIGYASAAGQYAGATLNLAFSGVQPGMTFYVKVTGADTSAFGTGKYALGVSLGLIGLPFIPPPVTATLNGTPLVSGSAQPEETDHDHDHGEPGVEVFPDTGTAPRESASPSAADQNLIAALEDATRASPPTALVGPNGRGFAAPGPFFTVGNPSKTAPLPVIRGEIHGIRTGAAENPELLPVPAGESLPPEELIPPPAPAVEPEAAPAPGDALVHEVCDLIFQEPAWNAGCVNSGDLGGDLDAELGAVMDPLAAAAGLLVMTTGYWSAPRQDRERDIRLARRR